VHGDEEKTDLRLIDLKFSILKLQSASIYCVDCNPLPRAQLLTGESCFHASERVNTLHEILDKRYLLATATVRALRLK